MRTILALCLGVALATASNPVFPTSFMAQLSVVRVYKNNTIRGTGNWDVSLPGQKELYSVKYDAEDKMFDEWTLARYDQERVYVIDQHSGFKCEGRPLDVKMENVWDWVKNASADGQQIIAGASYDAYAHPYGYLNITVLVSPKDPNVPVYVIRKEANRDIDVTIKFVTFVTTISQNSTSFNVPTACKSNKFASAAQPEGSCVARSDMSNRAITWYNAKVPYNQGGTWNGYREDCSGFVSYTWQSGAPGLSTSEFHEMGKYITKAQLLPGDAMLNAGEHVCFFNGWADSAQSTFHAIEEADTQLGTLNHVIKYPYYYDASSFLPFRYNNAC